MRVRTPQNFNVPNKFILRHSGTEARYKVSEALAHAGEFRTQAACAIDPPPIRARLRRTDRLPRQSLAHRHSVASGAGVFRPRIGGIEEQRSRIGELDAYRLNT